MLLPSDPAGSSPAAAGGRTWRASTTPSAVGFVIALGVVAAVNFLFHAVVSRQLPAGEYASLVAVLAVLMALSVPASAVEVTVTREVARLGGRAHLRAASRSLTRLTGAGTAMLVVAAPILAATLRVSTAVAILLAMHVPAMVVGHVGRGVLQGAGRFAVSAASALVGASVKLLAGAAGAVVWGLDGAVAATLMAEVAAAAVAAAAARHHSDRGAATLALSPAQGALGIGALVGFWLLAGADTVLARALLPSDAAGAYAAAATIGRAALFAPLALVTVAFTRFAAAPHAARSLLARALPLVLATGGLAAGLLSIDPTAVMGLALGEQFLEAAWLVTPLAALAAALGVVSLLAHYHLADGRRAALVPWIGVAVTCAAAVLRHDEVAHIAQAAALGIAMSLAAGAVSLRRGRREPIPTHSAAPALATTPAVEVSVVVPFYNPGPALVDNLQAIAAQLQATGLRHEIIAVCDGSTDGSADLLGDFDPAVVRVIRLPDNRGKGAALRTGLSQGRGRYVGFIDSDGDLDAALWAPFLALMELYEPDIVLGSKRHPLSEVHYPWLRRVYSVGFQVLTKMLFRLNIRDTQTGIKLVRREVLADVLPLLVEQRFTFDLELLVVAKRLGYTRFLEAPVRLRHQFSSTVSARSVLRMLRDTALVFARLHLSRRYTRRAHSPATSVAAPLRTAPSPAALPTRRAA